jgi:hypothetical protein
MTVSTGSPIIASDLNSLYTSIGVQQLELESQVSENCFSMIFDGATSAWTSTTRDAFVSFVPVNDIILKGITSLAASTAVDGTYLFTIESQAQGNLSDITLFADVTDDGNQTRKEHAGCFGTGVRTVNAGDTLTIRITSTTSALPIQLLRIHLFYNNFHSKG